MPTGTHCLVHPQDAAEINALLINQGHGPPVWAPIYPSPLKSARASKKKQRPQQQQQQQQASSSPPSPPSPSRRLRSLRRFFFRKRAAEATRCAQEAAAAMGIEIGISRRVEMLPLPSGEFVLTLEDYALLANPIALRARDSLEMAREEMGSFCYGTDYIYGMGHDLEDEEGSDGDTEMEDVKDAGLSSMVLSMLGRQAAVVHDSSHHVVIKGDMKDEDEMAIKKEEARDWDEERHAMEEHRRCYGGGSLEQAVCAFRPKVEQRQKGEEVADFKQENEHEHDGVESKVETKEEAEAEKDVDVKKEEEAMMQPQPKKEEHDDGSSWTVPWDKPLVHRLH